MIRIHDVAGLTLLERAVQSLHGQLGVHVQPIIVMQRFDADEIRLVRDAVRRQWFFDGLPEPMFLNFGEELPVDARSCLLNLGIAEHLVSGNRYLAFLDHDDVLYSHAYRVLVERLTTTGAAMSFATVELAEVVPLKDYEFVYRMTQPFKGKNKIDLVRDNFCPLHSYLVDTTRVDAELLYFDPELVRVEDYDFLLRVAGRHPCDFRLLGTRIGMYVRRADGTNSTPVGVGPVTQLEVGSAWKDSHAILDQRRAAYPIQFYATDFPA